MAELTLGLAKSAVETTVRKVQSAIEEEAELKERVQYDLVFITDEFQTMQSFLKDLNSVDREQLKSNVVRTWVSQVRELAYDVEDSIELVVHLDGDKSYWWRRFLASCCWCCPSVAPALPLDEAVADVKQLRVRVADVSLRNMRYRYNLIADYPGKPAAVDAPPPPPPQQPAAATAFEAAAREQRRHCPGDLTQLVAKEGSELRVISLWGTGGEVGTTSIIREAYDNTEIRLSFRCRAWVNLVHPFNLDSLLQSLQTQFNDTSSGQEQGRRRTSTVQGKFLVEEFTRQVQEQRYLVVLEGLSSIAEWDAIRDYLPDKSKGSRIIVSTEMYVIASLCTRQPFQIWELNQLVDHSIHVLFKEGSQHEHPFYSKMVEAQYEFDEVNFDGRTREVLVFSSLLEKHKVVAVWGVSGVGKSAFVKRSYYWKIKDAAAYYKKIEKATVKQNIHQAEDYYWKIREAVDFDRYGWVDVSHPFSLKDFSRSLFLDLCPELRQAEENADFYMSGVKDPIKECHGFLRDQRCLVVIDGLRSPEEWDLIKANLANGPFASSIIVITNEASVAEYCTVPSKALLSLRSLEADKSFDLFKKVVYKMNPEFDVDVCIKLIRKCGGLPKVIVAIARLLVTSKTNTSQLVQSMNTRFMGMLKTKPEVDGLRDLIGWTHYYLFQTCPVYLRPCILYLSSVFPGHCGVRRRRLVMRWVAEGYSKDTDSHTAEDNGEKFFSELVELDMVQHPPKSITTVFNETRMVLCQVNTFFQEYIISQPLEDNDFTLALEAFTLKGQCRPTTQRRGRHLVIEESWERDKIVFDSIDFSWLRSMTVFGNWEPYFVSEKMRLLRVLDLEEVSGLKDDDLERMMRLLCRLKFLSLRGCTNICHLPRSCGALRQLQTLDIRHTSIVTLPSTITKLPKLQYLRAGMAGSQWTLSNTNVLLNCSGRHQIAASVKVPAGIKQLTTLHTLGVLNASATGGKAILGELKELTQLRKLGVFGINRRNNNEFISAIASLRYLESLSVWFSEDNEQAGRLDGLSHPPKKLQSLKLYYNHVDRLPIWIDQLGNLRKLDLEMIMPTQEDIHLLGDLKFCIILRLCVNPSQDGEELHFSVRPEDTENNRPKGLGFPSLEVLEIACNSRLSLVMFEPRVMRLLEPLKVRCYGGQPSVRFSGLKNLNNLKEISLGGTYDGEVVEALNSEIKMCRKKPALKLEEQPST